MDLHVPKHRDGEPFHTMLFNNYNRSEAALILVMAEMVVNGISTRKVTQSPNLTYVSKALIDFSKMP